MAIVNEDKWLEHWEKCDPAPDNAYKIISEWYCVDGYEPSGDKKSCVPIEADPFEGYDPSQFDPDGIGRVRHLFEHVAIDRSFDVSRYRRAYIERKSWDDAYLPSVEDPVRAATGRFWTITRDEDGGDVKLLKDLPEFGEPAFGYFFLSASGKAQLVPENSAARFADEEDKVANLQSFADNIPHGIWFEDNTFKVTSPLKKSVFDALNLPNTKYADIRSSYNIYIPKYEELSLSGISERVLPNLYVFKSRLDGNSSDNILNHSTLTGVLDNNDYLKLNSDYFDLYAEKYPLADEEQISALASSFTDIIVSHSNVDVFDYNEKKTNFPMHFNIEFSTSTNTEFADLLKDTNMGCYVMNKIIANDGIGTDPFIEFLSGFDEEVLQGVSGADATTRRSIDITSWFNDDVANPISSISASMGKPGSEVTDLQSAVCEEIIRGRLNDLKSHCRSYDQIMQGIPAHSETVLYRIEKMSGSSLIQNFYLPNSNDINVHEFVDTQIKYGKQYTYNIYVWELVYGTEYQYIASEIPSGAHIIHTKVETRENIKLVEVPYYTHTSRALDKPPVQPNVEIVPFRGISNKFKINLSSNTGKYDLPPVTIEGGELNEVQELLRSQGRSPQDKLEYRSDDYSASYEIYRTDEHPAGYEDFGTKLLKTLDTGNSTAASTTERVVPNKKYWYAFRSIDVHGHRSYPSPVYEVEMVDDKGSVYMLMRVVEFKDKSMKEPLDSFKRLIHLRPSISQSVLNGDTIAGLDSVVNVGSSDLTLGVEDESLWGQTFRIRLTSRKTGRKVDLKVKFTKTHDDTAPN